MDADLRTAERLRNEDPEAYARQLVRSGEAQRALEITKATIGLLPPEDVAPLFPLALNYLAAQQSVSLVTSPQEAVCVRPEQHYMTRIYTPVMGPMLLSDRRQLVFSCWWLRVAICPRSCAAELLISLYDRARDERFWEPRLVSTLGHPELIPLPRQFEQAQVIDVDLTSHAEEDLIVQVALVGAWADRKGKPAWGPQ